MREELGTCRTGWVYKSAQFYNSHLGGWGITVGFIGTQDGDCATGQPILGLGLGGEGVCLINAL